MFKETYEPLTVSLPAMPGLNSQFSQTPTPLKKGIVKTESRGQKEQTQEKKKTNTKTTTVGFVVRLL